MACQFCATGQAGFQRHLSEGEIVEQVAVAIREARPRRLSNVVFMGMGEPLANYDRVWGAVVRLNGDMGLSARHLTLSTVGMVPGIRRLAAETLPVNLAVSLHAANDTPARRAGPHQPALPARRARRRLRGLRGSERPPALHRVGPDRRRQRPEQRCVPSWPAFARPLGAHVNLIPLNPTPGYPVVGSPAGARAALPRRAAGDRGERHHPRHPGGGHRCRLRAAGRVGSPAGSAPPARRAGASDCSRAPAVARTAAWRSGRGSRASCARRGRGSSCSTAAWSPWPGWPCTSPPTTTASEATGDALPPRRGAAGPARRRGRRPRRRGAGGGPHGAAARPAAVGLAPADADRGLPVSAGPAAQHACGLSAGA